MMARFRKLKRILATTLAAIVVLLVAAITFTIGWRPLIGAKARTLTSRNFEPSPERLARGKYLTEGVMGCFGCHTKSNESLPGAPPVEAQLGAGCVFDEQEAPWLTVPNITPDVETGVGAVSDDALARAIREGIGHDGRALFPIMPYQLYRQMPDEDLASVIVYLRSLKPVRNELPPTRTPFPLNLIVKTLPEPVSSPVEQQDLSNPVKRGAYLVEMAACTHCHTPMDKGALIEGMYLAGGEQRGPLATPNITPDASGISYYDEATFIKAIRSGQVGARKLHPVMPWVVYRNMTDDDLKAIYAYLRTIPPVRHRVDNAEPPTECKLCGHKHGAGD
jgi:mono/diheme cytochrome c family protein